MPRPTKVRQLRSRLFYGKTVSDQRLRCTRAPPPNGLLQDYDTPYTFQQAHITLYSALATAMETPPDM